MPNIDYSRSLPLSTARDKRKTIKESTETFNHYPQTDETITILEKVHQINKSFNKAVDTLTFACDQKMIPNEFQIIGQSGALQLHKISLTKILKLQKDITNMINEALE